jgi:predicted DNA-binding WGR domain protein
MTYLENSLKQRYYILYIAQDLFQNWCLKRTYGSLLNKRGKTITQVCNDEKHAFKELVAVEFKKRHRGYA